MKLELKLPPLLRSVAALPCAVLQLHLQFLTGFDSEKCGKLSMFVEVIVKITK